MIDCLKSDDEIVYQNLQNVPEALFLGKCLLKCLGENQDASLQMEDRTMHCFPWCLPDPCHTELRSYKNKPETNIQKQFIQLNLSQNFRNYVSKITSTEQCLRNSRILWLKKLMKQYLLNPLLRKNQKHPINLLESQSILVKKIV